MDDKEVQELQNALSRAKANLTSLVEELHELEHQTVVLKSDIRKWQNVIEALSSVLHDSSADLPSSILLPEVDNEPLTHLKFTDAVREVFRQAGHTRVTAPQVRDQLTKMGFDFSKYKQALVPVHNTLKRLEDQGEIEAIKSDEGQTIAYQRIDLVKRALAEEIERSKKYAAYGSQVLEDALNRRFGKKDK